MLIKDLKTGMPIIIQPDFGVPRRMYPKKTVVLYQEKGAALCTDNTLLFDANGDGKGVEIEQDEYDFLFVKPEAMKTMILNDWLKLPEDFPVSAIPPNQPIQLETEEAGRLKLEFISTEERIAVRRQIVRSYKLTYWLKIGYYLLYNHDIYALVPICRFVGISNLAAWKGYAEIEVF